MMSDQSRVSRCRAAVVFPLLAGAILALTGCGGGSDKKPDDASSIRPIISHSATNGQDGPSSPSEPSQILAQVRGERDMVITITSSTRDAGGFVTVQGTVTNNGTSAFNAVSWRGQELSLAKSGPSVAGAVLVDQPGKKRYYVLRDTEGKCLCTMGLTLIKPKESRPFFAQFPAPPQGTTEVEFQLPTMPPAKIQISEG